MLQIKNISKIYENKNLKQIALDKVSINFRKSEFVSILGPSGSGKTTLLNIIGGLDNYDSGDLIINKISTKKYKDKDWDSYRNHRIGFIFQNYNLIIHQSVLKNVELALTLSGISKKERIRRAKKVLKQVGLEKHINKRPTELSGGQMQRVAIARALVNDPDILLADEPTGALDSVTSIQIMDLLKKVAKDKLVIMVTHNPDLAATYSNRIIKLKDGKIIEDSNYYNGLIKIESKNNDNSKKTSMKLFTALALSFNNLLTKKSRTFLTSFAGSIGIIGIAMVLSLSKGVTEYINKIQRDTLTSYPITVEKNSDNLFNISKNVSNIKCNNKNICVKNDITKKHVTKNNLEKFKKYLNNKKIENLVTDIKYSYDLDMHIYTKNNDEILRVNPNSLQISSNLQNDNYDADVFNELNNNKDLLESKYTLLKGIFPNNYNELILIIKNDNTIDLSTLYKLNIKKMDDDKKNIKISFDSIIGKTYKLVLNNSYFKKENGIWLDKSNDIDYMKKIIDESLELKIVGIAKVKSDEDDEKGFVGYTSKLTNYVIERIKNSDIAKEQMNNKDINVFTGKAFDNNLFTYDNNLKLIGINDIEKPNKIDLYPKDFKSKKALEKQIEKYNKDKKEEDKISYIDYVGLLLSSVTSIVNVISYILIAFIAVSLIVSSIMISIITYISVLERTKEIGILRAIGASKKDISMVFNAETIIEGLIAGILGILIAYLFTIIINIIIKNLLGITSIAKLTFIPSIILIIISILLTLIAGLIPSKIASKKNPVESLRAD